MSSITVIADDLGNFAVRVENMAHNQEKIKQAVTKSTLSIERQAKQNLTANGAILIFFGNSVAIKSPTT
jgi:hypothetical protein